MIYDGSYFHSCFFRWSTTYLCLWALFWTETSLQELEVIHKYPNYYKGVKSFCDSKVKIVAPETTQELEKWKKWKHQNYLESFSISLSKGFLISMLIRKRHSCVFPISNSACYSVLEAAPATSDLCENLCWQAPQVSKLNVAPECF